MNYLTRDMPSVIVRRRTPDTRATMIQRAIDGDPAAQMYCVKYQIDLGVDVNAKTRKGIRP